MSTTSRLSDGQFENDAELVVEGLEMAREAWQNGSDDEARLQLDEVILIVRDLRRGLGPLANLPTR